MPKEEAMRNIRAAALYGNDIWNGSINYQIMDSDSGVIKEEDEFEDGKNDMMFPDRESGEGFDADSFFDR